MVIRFWGSRVLRFWVRSKGNMDTTLVIVTLLSMGMAGALSVIVWGVLGAERGGGGGPRADVLRASACVPRGAAPARGSRPPRGGGPPAARAPPPPPPPRAAPGRV